MSMDNSKDVPAVPPAPNMVAARSPLQRRTMAAVALLVLVVDVVITVAMWHWVDSALPDLDKRATAHLDVLKLAASIVVGGGGLFALYLAARRQQTQEFELEERKRELAQREKVQAHAEQVAEDNRVDAVERRITELYLKAVEQLGSGKAAVRLGGIYALERLAQDNVKQRPTVVSVFCAYLRMPFESPGDLPQTEDTDYKTALAEHREWVQEREVRVTAQRVLRDHLRKGSGEQPLFTYWADTDLDLTGAHLIGFDLSQCTTRTARFGSATFIGGGADFRSARFSGPTDFGSATFSGGVADFGSATFTGSADFGSATFTSVIHFRSATFVGGAEFKSARFSGPTDFGSASFTLNADFESSKFDGSVFFGSARFSGSANFDLATFTGYAHFGSVMFASPYTHFESATFTGGANFKSATFSRRVPPEVTGFLTPTE